PAVKPGEQLFWIIAIEIHSPDVRRTRSARHENNVMAIRRNPRPKVQKGIGSQLSILSSVGIHDPNISIAAGSGDADNFAVRHPTNIFHFIPLLRRDPAFYAIL